MCGIAGYWGVGNSEILKKMRDSLTHRGPDEEGMYIHGDVGLSHRRLSILDLSQSGRQPMSNDNKSVTLVFNGEIYNYRELKNTYLADAQFRGTSDTEVLLKLYEKFGESFLTKIRGMFALAIYDVYAKKLILARDHLGKKPLYWTNHNGTLIFGSELKSLRQHPLCSHELDRSAISQYLVYEYIPAPLTIYRYIQKLEPGTYLTYFGKETSIQSYSELIPSQGSYTGSFENAQSKLSTLLEEAVTKRLVADVPVGVFLSGGLDSSTVAYFAQKATQGKIKTYSIGFNDLSFNESEYARYVAGKLGTDHHERFVSTTDLLNLVGKLPRVLDEPMADSSIVPTLLLSEFARGEVKVALGGDGADELFFGYDTFRAHRYGLLYENIPRIVQKGIESVVNMMPVSHTYMSLDFKLKKFLSGFHTTPARRNTYWLSAFTPSEVRKLLTYENSESELLASTDLIYAREGDFWDHLQMEYLRGYLADDILVKTDRASMTYGLEVRAPFLDLDVVNFALTLPTTYKHRGQVGKYILKNLMAAYLPHDIVFRPKKGFNIPIGSWMRGELKTFVTERILSGKLVASGLFNPDALAILIESHMKGDFDYRKKLWTLLMLEMWMNEWYV